MKGNSELPPLSSAVLLSWQTIFFGLIVVISTYLLFAQRKQVGGKTVPTVQHGIPLFGALGIWQVSPPSLLKYALAKYGKVFKVNLLVLKFTYILGGEATRFFFTAPDTSLSFDGGIERVAKAILGPEGMMTGHAFKEVGLSYIVKGFNSPNRLQLYFSMIVDEVKKTADEWASCDSLNLFVSSSKLTSRVVIKCLMGEEVLHRYGDEIAHSVYNIEVESGNPLVMVLPTIPTPPLRRLKHHKQRVLKIISDELEARLANPGKYVDNTDYLQYIIGEGVTEKHKEHVPQHILSIALAAFTNTSGTMGWTIAQVAKDKTILAKLQKEFDTELTTSPVSQQELVKLPYLNACMKETVRKYSLFTLFRLAMEDMEFDGYFIKKGDFVAISPYMSHHDETVYPNADNYDPEKFTQIDAVAGYMKNMEYVQFGFGKHKCIGERFAGIVLKSVWYALFKDFDVKIIGELPEADFSKITGTPFPKGVITATVQRRK